MAVAQINTLEDARAHARLWLFETAAPLWSSSGLCADGLFAERLDMLGVPVDLPRRLRVQARQIYSFCIIGKLGWSGPWREIVERATTLLLQNGRREDGLFGHLFDASGALCNESLDLYDHAFGLFALAHAGAALNRPEWLQIASEIQDQLDKTWARPQGGYWEGELTPCPPYRQNPHMHMFETALANHAASGEKRWRDMANRIGSLFESCFWEPESGAVTEYFDEDWRRLSDGDGDIVEPGHCLEWAWLFEVGFAHEAGVKVADGLTSFARKCGICPVRGVAINEVRLNGSIKDAGARLWPQTERLKAAMARYRRTQDPSEAHEAVMAYRGLIKYFDTPVKGLWRDRLNADGSWVEEAAPASSFYHIVCGLNELLELEYE